MNILSFYNRILQIASLTSDVEGSVSAALGGATRPYTVGGKRMMLPTPNVIAMPDKSKIVVFHPLGEHLLRGESEIMQQYRKDINVSMNYRIISLLQSLMELATSPAMHGHIKPQHHDVMSILKDADERTATDFVLLRKAMPSGNTDKAFVHTFIKKEADVGGRKYRRGAIVTFPLYEELVRAGGTEGVKGDLTVFGVKFRKKDHAAFKLLLEHMFPGIGEKNSYSRGGESDLSPSLDALLKSSLVLAGQVNSLIESFIDVLPEMEQYRYPDDWVDDARNLDQFSNELRLLPPQVGNEGAVERPGQPAAAVAASLATPGTIAMPVQATTQQWMAAPPATAASTPGALNDKGLVDMNQLLRTNPALAAYGNAPGFPGMGGYGAPMQPQTGAAALRMQGPSWANAMNHLGGNRVF